MAVSKLYRTCGQTLLPVVMFNYYICLYNTVSERNGNTICLNYYKYSTNYNMCTQMTQFNLAANYLKQ